MNWLLLFLYLMKYHLIIKIKRYSSLLEVWIYRTMNIIYLIVFLLINLVFSSSSFSYLIVKGNYTLMQQWKINMEAKVFFIKPISNQYIALVIGNILRIVKVSSAGISLISQIKVWIDSLFFYHSVHPLLLLLFIMNIIISI